jgi:DNA-directed RNA polymerase specialized sigma24 family protein
MTLEEALNNNDMNEIIDSMTAYVYGRIKTIGAKGLEGKTPEDFVGEVLMKVAEGERDWSKSKIPFKDFLFGCLKSHMYNFFKSFEHVYETELPDIQSGTESGNESELKQIAIKALKENGADQDEIDVFECWIEDMNKPAEIAELLGRNVKAIYNITKRLERKMPKLQTQIIKFV